MLDDLIAAQGPAIERKYRRAFGSFAQDIAQQTILKTLCAARSGLITPSKSEQIEIMARLMTERGGTMIALSDMELPVGFRDHELELGRQVGKN